MSMNAPRNPMSASAPATPGQDAPSDQKSATGPGPRSPFGRPGGDDDFVIRMDGVDLDSVGPVFVPEGQYLGYISNVERDISKSGNDMVVWTATVYDGPHAGKSLKTYTALTPNAMWKFVENCRAVGFPLEKGTNPSLKAVRDHALKVFVVMTVTEREGENKRVLTSLDRIEAPESGAGQRIPDAGVPR